MAMSNSHEEEKISNIVSELSCFCRIMAPPTDAESGTGFSSEDQAARVSFLRCQEWLDELQLYLKYLLFDLDATRRENGYLKKLLDQERS